jgi:uncharacterized protein YifN (PemK superfamily)
MQGTEIIHRDGVEFHIEHQHTNDRYPGLVETNPLLWWLTAKDRETFGDDRHHEVTGGLRTKKGCYAEIERYIGVRQATQAHRERMRQARTIDGRQNAQRTA